MDHVKGASFGQHERDSLHQALADVPTLMNHIKRFRDYVFGPASVSRGQFADISTFVQDDNGNFIFKALAHTIVGRIEAVIRDGAWCGDIVFYYIDNPLVGAATAQRVYHASIDLQGDVWFPDSPMGTTLYPPVDAMSAGWIYNRLKLDLLLLVKQRVTVPAPAPEIMPAPVGSQDAFA